MDAVDQPSPVRASAQAQAKELHLKLDRAGAEWSHGSSPGVVCYPCSLIEAELLAAEARGRQQAEQARDEESRKLAVAEADYEHQLQTSYDLLKQRDALTQALKDAQGEAFKAGYHCQWIKAEMRYIFDPAMSPGDPDGAFAAWLRAKEVGDVGAQAKV